MPTTRLDYGLRALVALAAAPSSLKSEEIARPGSMPQRYLEQVLNDLRRAGLVCSKRGGGGGYWLARPADEITVADVMEALTHRSRSRAAAGPLESVWVRIADAATEAAAGISLLDLARPGAAL
jgi:Rrf2 family protein